ncbi:MAG: hypothetical protein JG782_1012 [Anaerophaga sp.]|nr:hypothetical protein [Anaerophaga sp.]MDK2841755.1 hypothetical protein [Anaerophaga sp.]MDN5291347.1 hypothetical protein [Anaerophaga sp.]
MSIKNRFHQYKISLSYSADGTRMIEVYTCSFVTNLVMLVSSDQQAYPTAFGVIDFKCDVEGVVQFIENR